MEIRSGQAVVKENPLTIDIPKHGEFALGDDIEIGGGLVVEHSSDKIEPGAHEVGGGTVSAECAKHDIWLAH